MTGNDLARAAEQFIGRPFRLHGRDPATGLDCIGLLASTFAVCGLKADLPNGYCLRTGSWQGLEEIAWQLGFAPCLPPFAAGDICLFRPSPIQMHFTIVGVSPTTMVEAHAGLRRVTLSSRPHVCAPFGHWRLAPEF